MATFDPRAGRVRDDSSGQFVLGVKGAEQILKRLNKLADTLPDLVGAAMRAEAEIEMTEAKKRTPVDTGALRASGRVEGPRRFGRDLTVYLRFGGASVDYAWRVHEDLEMFHRVGQAKFLESVLLESAPYMALRIAYRVKLMKSLLG